MKVRSSFTSYLSAITKPTDTCSFRRQMGQKSRGLRSDSSRWLEPCMTQLSHWQCFIPNMWPISCVIVWKEINAVFFVTKQKQKCNQSALIDGGMEETFRGSGGTCLFGTLQDRSSRVLVTGGV